MRNSTPETRQRQSEIARRDRPWTKSTGPRTQAGKKRSRGNALKHGYESAAARAKRDALCRALRAQAAHVRAVNRLITLKKSAALCAEEENELLCAVDRQGYVVLYDLRRAIQALGLLPAPVPPPQLADKKTKLIIQDNVLHKKPAARLPSPSGVHIIAIPEKMTNGPDKNLLRIDMTKRGAL